MKVICRPNNRERQEAARTDFPGRTRLWNQALPFNVNPRGVLVHRVRSAKTHIWRGKRSHDSVNYWCWNGSSGEGVNLVEIPPVDRLLCAQCERKAVEAGEPSAETLAGRHVYIGVMKAHRLCCTGEEN